MNRLYLDPLLLGVYPDEVRAIFADAWPEIADAEASALAAPIDFLGVNYYTRKVVRRRRSHYPTGAVGVPQRHAAHTAMEWEVYPTGLTNVLCWIRERYGPIPIYVTENGAAFYDPPRTDGGAVDDPLRVSYFRAHLAAVGDAVAAGVDVRGYFAWSLLDNFEWSHGYSKRFGLIHVDFATQQRTLKASAAYYRDVIAHASR
jgi:beta-glucosidase